jgi:ABC-type glycerol-3-phosphate transport system substrate-binding protein
MGSKSSSSSVASITVWGDVAGDNFYRAITATGGGNTGLPRIDYTYKPSDTFNADLTEAIATGVGPDLVIISVPNIEKNKNKIFQIPETSFSQSSFRSTFLQEGELLLATGGAYGLPLISDPMILYWNRDIFNNAALVAPPTYWDEIYTYADKLTQKDDAGNIKQSTIALGETKNIPQAKNIINMLMLQAGTPITMFQGDRYHAILTNNLNFPTIPAAAALDFYTQFSNPTKKFYSWNSSMLSAQTAFTSGNTAMYLGFASELPVLRAKNPTLNLGVALVPQSRIGGNDLTFGRLESVSILKSSKNIAPAFVSALAIVSNANDLALANTVLVPPARRDLLSILPTDPFQSIFYTAAIQSTGWLDPDEQKTDTIFTDMIDSVTSGRAQTLEAISAANTALDALIKP